MPRTASAYSPEVFAYVISKNSPSGTITIDTVYNSVTYLDTTAHPEERTETYFIVAIDRCGNSSLVPAPHNTMFLTAEVGSACDRSVRLSWNAYQNWGQGISTNKIWVRENNALPKLQGEVAGDQNTFVFENAQPGIEYCFSIQAEENNTIYNSTSNIICLTLDVVPGVSELVVTNATITPDNTVNLSWFWNNNAAIDDAEILRSQGNANLSAIFSGMPPSPLSRNNSFVDENVNLSGNPITYQINTTDACDVQVQSNTVTTIFLEVQNQGSENLLRWTAYKNEYASNISYELYRQPASGVPVFIATSPDGTFEYKDAVDTNNPDAVGACYFVLAKVSLSLPDGKILMVESRSNLACATQDLKLYIPNAFAPNGANKEFKPILPFGELNDYSMVIYNRWGERVFEARNIDDAWDGKAAGRDMPQGGYVYYIRLTTADGTNAEYAGMLTLIR
ncbi:MAG: gliding motility-associated C-terminal domain-containing protein [Saprospiraceae bacterium]|nr:gliding motility-associated C-terminal domain-containing protein [Saprospiraceae bacterium]